MKRLIITLLAASTCVVMAAKDKAAVTDQTDIVVGDTTLVQRCVLKGANSSRIVAVGHPGGFNYAFDAINCAPVTTWRGGFLDFAGETNGRGGNGCKALGVQQTLGVDAVPLRVGKPDAMPASIHFHGYRRGASGEPTFLFEVDGVSVEQRLNSPKPFVIALHLAFPVKHAESLYYLLDPTPHLQVKLGDGLKWSGPGRIEIPAGQSTAEIKIHLKPTDKTFVREVEQLSGADIFRNFCSACHSTDGTKLVGPTFKGLWGREEVVTRNGTAHTLKVDADYVRESILKPQAAIVKGYEAVPMADYSTFLTPPQIESLISFLQHLE